MKASNDDKTHEAETPYEAWMREQGISFQKVGTAYAIYKDVQLWSVNFDDVDECKHFIVQMVNKIMEKPIARFIPKAIIVIIEEGPPPKVRAFETVREFADGLNESGDQLGVRDLWKRKAAFPDADLFAYFIYPNKSAALVPMWNDGGEWKMGSAQQGDVEDRT